MKRLVFLFTVALTGFASSVIWAQPKPKLASITFLNGNNGQPINCTAGGNLAVQLLFDRAMNNAIKPTIKYDLAGGAYNLSVPSTGNWQDTTLFQVVFNINANVPAGPDGVYSFLVFGAQSAAAVAMDSTYSDSLNSTLTIYRAGFLVSAKDTLDFGSISLGGSKLDSLILTNVGCSNISINSAALQNTTHFALLNDITGILQKNDSVVARIRYQPTSRRQHQTRLRVNYSINGSRASLEILLLGRARSPRIVFVPADTLSFGSISIGNIASRNLLVVNTPAPEQASSDTLRITKIVSSLPGIFGIAPLSLPLIIAPADTDTVTVTFSPDSSIVYNARLTFTSNDSTSVADSAFVALTGSGNVSQPPPPITQLNIDWGQFGYGYPGYSSSDSLYFCLPNNVDSVAFVRWKIVTNAQPPQGANDYTGSAIPFGSAGTLCFKVPLKGVLNASVRYYFYVWLDGSNGISGWYNYYALPSGLYYYAGAPVLTALNISSLYWPGGFPYYTNSDSIPICWNVQDGRNVAEVRWKLARSLTPPTSATDTTATDSTYGGGFKLAINDTTLSLACANLLLSRIRQQPGYWYAYVWVIDKAGNSSHTNAWTDSSSFRFKYDITAPAAPKAIRGRSIPANIWFGNNTTLQISVDQPDGPRDAAKMRWRFQTQPTGQNNPYDNQSLLTFLNAARDSASFSVLFNNAAPCGDDTLFFWLADSAGNANALAFQWVRYQFDRCPPTLMRVASLSNNVAQVGQGFNDVLLVQDAESGVDTVWVNYRLGGSNTEAPPIPALAVGNTGTYQFTIPSAGVTRRGVEFRATARDQVTGAFKGPNISNGPANGPNCYSSGDSSGNAGAAGDSLKWYPIRTSISGNGDFRIDANGNPVPLVYGDTTSSYQLFSIPYQLDNAGVLNTLQDDLGTYDQTQWRVFDYLPQGPLINPWKEGSSARPFAPGRSYFIITRKPNIVLDSGPGVTRRTVCPDTLSLQEGWNLIATPFNFPVHKRSLRLVNANQDTVSLWSFESQWTFTDVLDAWRGYAVYVVRGQNVPINVPIQLIVQPVAVSGRIGKASVPQFARQQGEWAVQITAQANSAQDNYNWAGLRHGALPGYDALEMAEPPVIGGYVSVSFPRAAWKQPAGSFCTDFRANNGEEQTWDFEVATNQTHSNVYVRFDFLGDFPAGAKVYVMDEVLGVVQDLRAKPEYGFRVGSQPKQKKLKLIVGGQEFASKQAGSIALVPEKFEVLQNYPNPFNPETSIRYNLSQRVPVRIEIYDQLGRKVRTLVNGEVQQQGYHSKLWDGRDDSGRGVATGIYIYKVTAGKESIAKKMLLQK